jgi:hypothetical protein
MCSRRIRGQAITSTLRVARVFTLVLTLTLATAVTCWTGWTLTDKANAVQYPQAPKKSTYWNDYLAAGLVEIPTLSLDIRVRKYDVTARYKFQLMATHSLIDWIRNDPSKDGNPLVDAVLGSVNWGEFRWGPTGHSLSWAGLDFQRPHIEVANGQATVSVTSFPGSLSLDHFRLSAGGHAKQISVKSDEIVVHGRKGDVRAPSNIVMASELADGTTFVRHNGGLSRFTYGNMTGRMWLNTLRTVGNSAFAIVGGSLAMLVNFAVLGVVLWALARRGPPSGLPAPSGLQGVATRAVRAVMWAVAAAIGMRAVSDLLVALLSHNTAGDASVIAGSRAVLLAGAFFLWPVMCVRAVREPPPPSSPPGAPPLGALLIPFFLLIPYRYMMETVLHVPSSAYLQHMLQAIMLVSLAVVLCFHVFGRRPPWYATVGVSATLLSSTLFWPVTYYQGETDDTVYLPGKWVYVAAGLTVTAGLCTLVAGVLRRTSQRTVRNAPIWTVGVIGLIAVTAILSLLQRSKIEAPGELGDLPGDLISFIDSSYPLVEWLLIGLMIIVVVATRATASRETMRRLGIALFVTIFFSVRSWLYLPLDRIGAFAVAALLVFPAAQTRITPQGSPRYLLQRTMNAWRHAELVRRRRNALEEDTPIPHTDLMSGKTSPNAYVAGLAHLSRVDHLLAEQQEERVWEAQQYKSAALGRLGAPLDIVSARVGGIVSGVLGLVPLWVTLSSTHGAFWPSADTLDLFDVVWSYAYWPLIGYFFGLFIPLLRGNNGIEKGFWLFLALTVSGLPQDVIWATGKGWIYNLVAFAEMFVICLAVGFVSGDLVTLRRARLRPSEWVHVHNWKFVVTWSTTVVVALTTATITYVSSSATELGKITVGNVEPPTPTAPAHPTTP